MDCSERAPADLLFDQVLVDPVLCDAIVLAGGVFRARIKGFLLTAAISAGSR